MEEILIPNPFANEILSEIFRTSPQYPDKPISRENSWLEFKQSFNWLTRDEYSRTLAAFAITKGGYIVFGISNRPRLLIGLQNDNFEKFDPARISEYLNDNFSPEIHWEMQLYPIQGKIFGLIYAGQASDKPVIAKKNASNIIKEGEIYYRYRGRTEKIKFPELRHIVDEQRRKEREYWLQNLKQIAKIGISNTAIFDINTGKVTGSGGSFFIDKKILPKLRFIKEGEFQERRGSPTLKLIGDLRTVDSGLIQPTKTVFKPKAINTAEIIDAFLGEEKVSNPIEFIKQICFESSSFLPTYYFLKLGGITKKECLEILKNVQSRSQSRHKLIERIEEDKDFSYQIPLTNSEASNKIRKFREQLLSQSVPQEFEVDELKYLLKAIRTLEFSQIDHSYLFPLLKRCFDTFYANVDGNLAGELRRTICYVDFLINKN
jgi:hypothetical protein